MADKCDDILRQYVKKTLANSSNWEIRDSPLGGRGLFSTRDLEHGTLLFEEPPLLIGPRSGPRCPLVCTGCLRSSPTQLCSKCQLPLCQENCEQLNDHLECSILEKLPELSLPEKVALIAPLRAIFLGPTVRNVLSCLEGHEKNEHKKLQESLAHLVSDDDLHVIQQCSMVLDATAFEVPCVGKGGSVRGIFPVAALMNHHCSPNTRHCYDEKGRMVVETTKAVLSGDELCTTYTCLTWGTQARRAHLQATKKFTCNCSRCADPSENSANLMALNCMGKDCRGVLLPCTNSTNWSCTECNAVILAQKTAVIQCAISGMLAKTSGGTLAERCASLRNNRLVPNSNQAAIDYKFSLLRCYGSDKNIPWTDLSTEDLAIREIICEELLLLLTTLGLGMCRERGHLLLDLILTLKEKHIRRIVANFDESIHDIYKEGASIFKYDPVSLILLNAAYQSFLTERKI